MTKSPYVNETVQMIEDVFKFHKSYEESWQALAELIIDRLHDIYSLSEDDAILNISTIGLERELADLFCILHRKYTYWDEQPSMSGEEVCHSIINQFKTAWSTSKANLVNAYN